MNHTPVVSLADFASELHVSKETIRRWVRSHHVEPAQYIGRTPVFTPDELDRAKIAPRPKVGRPRKPVAA